MVKNLPTIERSTRIRFGRNATEDQAENTIVFNASNVELQATNPGAVYLSPIRFREDFSDPEIVLLMYNKQTGEITESGSSASTAVEPPFQLVSGFGNTTTYTLEFNNPETAFVTESNVGIANSNPVHTLDVGSNLFVEDTGSNVLTVLGNTYIQNDVNIDGNLNVKGVFARIDTVNTSIKDAIVELGRGNTSSDLGLIMDRPDSNVTVGFREGTDELIMAYTDSSAEGTTIVPLTSKDLSVRVYGNVEANYFTGDGSLLSNIASNLQEITDNGNTTSNTVQFTNPDVGLVATGNVEASNFVATGNVEASYFIGDGSLLSNIASNLQEITDNGNTTSNTVQFTNPDVGLVATGNVEASYFIGDGSQLTGIAATLEDVVTNSNTTSNTVQFTNTDVGLVATGNIQANYFIGDGSQLSNVATTLQAITDNGNTTSNTIQFTNNNVSLTTLGNVTVGSNFSKALFEVVSYTEITPEFRQSGQTIQTTSSSENMGWSVSISGDGTRAVVGAPYNGTNNTGRVAVYDLSGSQWTQVGSDIVGQSTSAFLGRSLAISYDGSRIAIGNDVNNKVMIYELVNSAWTQLGNDITGTGGFGYAVALSSDGSYVVVGTDGGDYVEVYEWSGSNWSKRGSTMSWGSIPNGFGNAVDISSDGSRIVIGIPEEGSGLGRLRVYDYNGSQWQLILDAFANTISGQVDSYQYYSTSVGISADGSRIIVSAAASNTVQSFVHVLEYDGSNWSKVGNTLYGDTTNGQFGHSAAISSDGSRIVVGAYNTGRGYVQIYELDNNQWNQIGANLVGVSPEDEYGWDVDISGDGTRVIVGIPGTSSTFTDGAVKLYNYVTADEATFFEVDNVNSRVGIMTDSPAYTLDVHGDANVESLAVTSNIGIGTTTPQYNLDVRGTANVDSITVTNGDVGIVATGNVEANYFIGDGSQLTGLAATLEDVVTNSNTTSNTVQFTNSDVGIVATGNVEANYFIGDGSQLTGLVTDLESVANNGNTTSNTIQFTNPTTAFTTDLTSNVGLKLEQLANVNITTPQTDHLLVYDGSDWVNEYNIHNFIKVHNTTGSTLYKGNVVYIVDSFNNNVANVALAKSDSSSTMPAIGLIHEDILTGQEGSAVAYGKVQGIDTTGFTEGQTVYVSNTSAGNIMNTKPYGLTDQIQNVGVCIKVSQNNGVVFVTGVGRSNDIPNAPIVTDPSYVYVNDQNNDLKKIEPSNLLTQLQTLQQVTDTSNTTSNTVQFTNTDVSLTTSGAVSVGSLTSTSNIFEVSRTVNLPEINSSGTWNGASYVKSNSDGSMIVARYSAGYTRVFEWNEFSYTWTKRGNDVSVSGAGTGPVDISDDGNRIVVGYPQENSARGAARVYELNGNSWVKIAESAGTQNGMELGHSVAISGDGSKYAYGAPFYDAFNYIQNFTVNNAGVMSVKDVGTNSIVSLHQTIWVAANIGRYVDLSYNGSIVAFSYNDIAYVGDTSSNPVANIKTMSSSITGLSLRSDGLRLAVAGAQSTNDIEVYDNVRTTPILRSTSANGNVVELSGDGNTLICGDYTDTSNTGRVKVLKWNGSTWEQFGRDLVGTGTSGTGSSFGSSVSISTDASKIFVHSVNTISAYEVLDGTYKQLYIDQNRNRIVANNIVEAGYFMGDGSQLTNISTTLQSITENGNTTSNTVQFTNTDVGIVATGNVQANYFIGDGSQLQGLSSTLEDVVTNSNITSNTVQFTNTDVGIVATGNVHANNFIGNVYASNVTISDGLIVNTGGVTKKFYSYKGTIPDQNPTSSSNVSLTFTSNIFYAKVIAHLVEDETEFSNMSLEVGGGSRTGGTTPNLKLGSVSVFGNASTNPWDSAVDVSTYAGSLEITPSATINNGDTPGTKPDALYNIFVEYISPDHVNGRLSSISLGGTTVKTFNY